MTLELDQVPLDEPEDLGDPDDRPEPTSGLVVENLRVRPRLMPWLELRRALGRSRDRRKLLQFVSATSGYAPHSDPQIRFHLADSGTPEVRTNKLAVTGIRFGKTTMAVGEHYGLHLVNPGCDHICVAPTYDQCREVLLRKWDELATESARRGYPLLKKWNWSLLRADLHCGGRVFFRSADKIRNVRGFEFASVLLDEADYTRNPLDTLNTLAGRLSDPKAHIRQLTVTTTPYEYSGSTIQFFADMRLAAAELPDPAERQQARRSWWFMRASTLDNPTLAPDFVRSTYALSKSEWLREIGGFPVIHRSAKAFACWKPSVHIRRETYDPRYPYSLAIDWGLHRPSYLWIQTRPDGTALVFWEYHPEDVAEEAQLDVVARVCAKLGKDPEDAGTDRADIRQNDRLKRLFRRCRIESAETRAEQDRRLSVSSILSLLEPLEGEPKLFVSESLTGPQASRRGVVAMFENAAWEWDSVRLCYRDVVEKDGTFDHAFDALGFWAKLIGVEKRRAVALRQIVGHRSERDKLAAIRQALGLV